MHPLDGPQLKLKRAKAHLNTLRRNLKAYYALRPYSFFVEEQPETGLNSLRIRVQPQPPERLGVFIGEFAFNLRSALDQIAWALAARGGREPPHRTMFPIWDVQPNTKNDLNNWKQQTAGIGAPDSPEIQLIESLQPYNREDAADTHPLFLVNDIGNADKHRFISVAGHAMRMVFPFGFLDVTAMFNDGEEVGMVGREFDPHGNFNPIRSSQVTFHVGKEGFPVSLPFLETLYEYVRNEVFPGFSRFFELPDDNLLARPTRRPPPRGRIRIPRAKE